MRTTLLTLALLLPAFACSSEKEAAEVTTPGTVDATLEDVTPATLEDVTPVALEASVHEVKCGCHIDEIGKCGNYVDVDGEWAMISNPKDHGLSGMEWCSAKTKVEATVAGTRTGKTIELTQLEVAK